MVGSNAKYNARTQHSSPTSPLPHQAFLIFRTMHTFIVMYALKSFWLVLALFMVAQSTAQADETSAPSGSSFQRFGQNYIDANLGVALLNGVIPFPGTSILFGRRSFGSESTFLDAELGLAFPSAVTAKLGVGRYNPATGKSVAAGIRPWPSHVYVQFGREDDRCKRDLKPRVERRLKRRGKDQSDIMCGEFIVSIEASAWFLETLFNLDNTGLRSRYRGLARPYSMESFYMVTWSHRWYLH